MKKYILIISILCLHIAGFSQVNVKYRLIMRNTGTDTMWDGKSMLVYGYSKTLNENPPIPGHILYANEGDTLIIDAFNLSQGDPHTIHPHGMDVNQENDGTPMTSFTIKHQKEYFYKIPCTHAGTYIYHCHMADVVHVQMGMYGLVIVRPKDGSKTAWTGGPAFQKEYAFLSSEFDKSWHDTVPMSTDSTMTDTMAREDFNVPYYKPDYFLINGKSKTQITKDSSFYIKGSANNHIFLRLGNIGYYMHEYIFPAKLNATIVESDGRPLPNIMVSDTLRIGPGERYGIMLNPKSEFADSIIAHFINMNTMQIADTEYLPVSIQGIAGIENKIKEENIQIYPVPADDEMVVNIQDAGIYQFNLVNLLGQNIKSWNDLQGIEFVLNIKEIPSGIYFLHIKRKDSDLFRKVIIE